MSYILEALKRADAERQRGGVPGLHAQTGGGVMANVPDGTSGRPWLLAGAAVLFLLVGGALAWWWRAGPGASPVAVVGAAGAPVSAASVPVAPVPVAVTTAPAVVVTAASAVGGAPPPDRVVAPPPVAAPNVAARLAPPPALPGAAAMPPPPPQPSPPSAAMQAAAAPRVVAARGAASAAAVALPPVAPPSAAPVPERLPQWAELPEALRREVGPLNPGGSIYAEQAAARMVILNGQVFREGDSLAAHLRVEQIRSRSVVFSLRGQRFELAL